MTHEYICLKTGKRQNFHNEPGYAGDQVSELLSLINPICWAIFEYSAFLSSPAVARIHPAEYPAGPVKSKRQR
jgi:hypothetical protein